MGSCVIVDTTNEAPSLIGFSYGHGGKLSRPRDGAARNKQGDST